MTVAKAWRGVFRFVPTIGGHAFLVWRRSSIAGIASLRLLQLSISIHHSNVTTSVLELSMYNIVLVGQYLSQFELVVVEKISIRYHNYRHLDS